MKNGRNRPDRKISFDIFRKEREHFYNTDCILLLYVLSGTVYVRYDNNKRTLITGALLVTNPSEWCFCDACAGTFITLTIPLEYLRSEGIEHSGRISCCAADDHAGAKGEFREIRSALANLWQAFVSGKGDSVLFREQALKLYWMLQELFSDSRRPRFLSGKNDWEMRLGGSIQYIHEHWQEDLRVEDIAGAVFLSPSYLSRLWRQHMDCTLFEYVFEIRLDHVEKQLHGTHSMTEIASACGFKNTGTMNQKFQEEFGVTPKQYRKCLQDAKKKLPVSLQEKGPDLTALLSYADFSDGKENQKTEWKTIVVDGCASGCLLRHTWRRLINIGYAGDGLKQPVQKQLIRAQKEIGFEYVRFHGIFDDDMHVFDEDEKGNLRLNFIFVDLLLDFLISLGLKPFIEFGYIPRKLAVHPIRVLERETYYSKVKDLKKWETLIRLFLQHVMMRYGKSEVLNWKFSVSGSELKLQGYLNAGEYRDHYVSSFRALKSVCARLQFGGFGGHSSLIMENEEFQEFIEMCMEEKCVPDFFCIQNFPVEYVKRGKAADPILLKKLSPVTISEDIHYSAALLRKTREILKRYCLGEREIWFEEWNASIWQRDIANDTCYKAAWLIKDVCENYDKADAFGYWLLTDFIEERLPHDGLSFFGGSSLITYNGIPKAGWNAMRLLRKLGDICISRGDGYFAERSLFRSSTVWSSRYF